METKMVMVIVISNGRVIVYEEMKGSWRGKDKEKFRFKIVQS
jgi:hypothetical protein